MCYLKSPEKVVLKLRSSHLCCFGFDQRATQTSGRVDEGVAWALRVDLPAEQFCVEVADAVLVGSTDVKVNDRCGFATARSSASSSCAVSDTDEILFRVYTKCKGSAVSAPIMDWLRGRRLYCPYDTIVPWTATW